MVNQCHGVQQKYWQRVLLCAFFVCSVLSTQVYAQPQLTLDEIVIVADSVRQTIKAIDVTYELEQIPVGGESSFQFIPKLRERVRFGFDSEDYIKYTQLPAANGELKEWVESRSGNVKTSYEPDGLSAVIDEDKDKKFAHIVHRAVILQASMLFPPKPGGSGFDDASLVSLLKRGKLREGTEIIDGRVCQVVDAFADTPEGETCYGSAWIDVERGALPIKVVSYVDNKRTPGMQQNLSYVTEFVDPDGQTVWLPGQIVTTTTIRGTTFKKIVTIDTSKTRVNPPVSQEDLSIKLPAGTVVFDNVLGKEYRIPGIVKPDNRDLGWPSNKKESSKVLPWVLLHVVLLAAIFGFMAYRRRAAAQPSSSLAGGG